MRTDQRPWFVRLINPGVPWWIAIPCNVVAAVALVLLILNPADNLGITLMLLVPASMALYGTALIRWWRQRRP